MFTNNRKGKGPSRREGVHGVLGAGSNSHILIDCDSSGDLKSHKHIVVTRSATFRGTLTGNTVSVYGSVDGSIYASQRVVLKTGSVIIGDIRTRYLTVEQGVEGDMKAIVSPDIEIVSTVDEKEIGRKLGLRRDGGEEADRKSDESQDLHSGHSDENGKEYW